MDLCHNSEREKFVKTILHYTYTPFNELRHRGRGKASMMRALWRETWLKDKNLTKCIPIGMKFSTKTPLSKALYSHRIK